MKYGVLNWIDRHACAGLPSVTLMPEIFIKHSMHAGRRMALVLALRPVLIAAALAAFAAVPLLAGLPRAQKHENRHEIAQLEEAWRTAVLKANTASMDALLANDYMAITPSGTLQSKDQTLANLRSGTVHFTTIEISDRKVRFYGTTALVTSRAEVSGSTADGDISGSYRYTRVYVRDEQGVWKIVSFEASRIRDPDDHK